MFHALGVPAGTGELLATLAVFDAGAGAAIAVLGYRLFDFWLPIPLAAHFYPGLRRPGGKEMLR